MHLAVSVLNLGSGTAVLNQENITGRGSAGWELWDRATTSCAGPTGPSPLTSRRQSQTRKSERPGTVVRYL